MVIDVVSAAGIGVFVFPLCAQNATRFSAIGFGVLFVPSKGAILLMSGLPIPLPPQSIHIFTLDFSFLVPPCFPAKRNTECCLFSGNFVELYTS